MRGIGCCCCCCCCGCGRGTGGGLADPELEALRTAVFRVAAQGVAAREAVPAQRTLVVASLQVDLGSGMLVKPIEWEMKGAKSYAVVVPVEVRFSLEFLGAGRASAHGRTRMGILALRVVRLHVGFPVVAALEELAADATLVSGLLGRGSLALLLDARSAGEDGLHVESRKSSVGSCGKLGDVAACVGLRPIGGRRAIEVLGLGSEGIHSRGVAHRSLGG